MPTCFIIFSQFCLFLVLYTFYYNWFKACTSAKLNIIFVLLNLHGLDLFFADCRASLLSIAVLIRLLDLYVRLSFAGHSKTCRCRSRTVSRGRSDWSCRKVLLLRFTGETGDLHPVLHHICSLVRLYVMLNVGSFFPTKKY